MAFAAARFAALRFTAVQPTVEGMQIDTTGGTSYGADFRATATRDESFEEKLSAVKV